MSELLSDISIFDIKIVGGVIVITYIARSMTNYLCKAEIITEDQKLMSEYGILTFIVNMISIVEILFLGLLTNTFSEAVVFIISIALLRSFTGGFHFNNYILCNICFSILYLLIVLIHTNISNMIIIDIVCLLSTLIICLMSPIVHIKKKLNNKKRIKNKYISIIITIMLLVFSFIFMNLDILKYTIISTALLQIFTIGGKDYVS